VAGPVANGEAATSLNVAVENTDTLLAEPFAAASSPPLGLNATAYT